LVSRAFDFGSSALSSWFQDLTKKEMRLRMRLRAFPGALEALDLARAEQRRPQPKLPHGGHGVWQQLFHERLRLGNSMQMEVLSRRLPPQTKRCQLTK
jgi:hypothetical protein